MSEFEQFGRQFRDLLRGLLDVREAPQGLAGAVAFTDEQLIAARVQPPFPNNQGTYENPDVVIAGGRIPPNLPAAVGCPGALVLYSSSVQIVANCAGFQGPGAGNNAVVQTALANAMPWRHGLTARMTAARPWVRSGAAGTVATCRSPPWVR